MADANGLRPSTVFAELFTQMVARAGRGLKRAVGEAVYLIDGSSLPLSGAGSHWARFSDQACGAKMHVVYDANAERPIYAAVTAANVNDITAAKEMPVEAGLAAELRIALIEYARGWFRRSPEPDTVAQGLA